MSGVAVLSGVCMFNSSYLCQVVLERIIQFILFTSNLRIWKIEGVEVYKLGSGISVFSSCHFPVFIDVS